MISKTKFSQASLKLFLQIGQLLGVLLTVYSVTLVSPFGFKIAGMILGGLIVLLLGKWQEYVEEDCELHDHGEVEPEIQKATNGSTDLGRRK